MGAEALTHHDDGALRVLDCADARPLEPVKKKQSHDQPRRTSILARCGEDALE